MLIFQDTLRTRSRHCWLLQKEFLDDLPVLSEPLGAFHKLDATRYALLRRCQALAEREEHSGAEILEVQGLEETFERMAKAVDGPVARELSEKWTASDREK